MNAIEAYFAEGEEHGIKQGIKQGIKKGIKHGEKKGSHNKNVQTIRKMVEKNLPISLITDVLEVNEAFVKGVTEGTITEIA